MFGGIGSFEMILFGMIALMLFGSKLPEVARNLGGTYRGLKKSVDEFKREFNTIETYEPRISAPKQEVDAESVETSAPRFSPPPAAPAPGANSETSPEEPEEK